MAIFDENGWQAPRFNEIVEIIQDDQISTIPQKFTYQNNKLIYQLNAVVARMVDLVAQGSEAAYDGLKLGSAEGVHLEELARLRGVYRIPAGRSNTSSMWALMTPGKTIPSGTLFYSSISGVEVYNPTVVTASSSSCNEAIMKTNEVIVEGAVYGFTVNGTNYTYTAQVGDDIADVHAGLVIELEDDTGKTFEFEDNAVGSYRVFIFTADEGTTLSVSSLTSEMKITTLKIYFYAEAVNTGPVAIDAEFIDSIRTPVVGVTTVRNNEAFRLGRDEETDVELRLRAQAGPLSNGTGTVPTIEQAILTNVDNVTLARVIENTNTSPVDADGRPIHSFELLVDGGFVEQELLDELWRVKGAGIETYGNTTGSVIDSGGVSRTVKYSTPTAVDIEVVVEYELYDEETPVTDRDTLIQNAVLNHINGLTIGKDVIVDRLIGPIYAAVPSGIGNLTITAQDSANPGFTGNRIPVGPAEFAKTVLGDITVTDVTPP